MNKILSQIMNDMSIAGMIALAFIPLTFLVITTVGIFQGKRKIMRTRIFWYVFLPSLFLPIFLVMTYIVWPIGTSNFGFRILVAVGIDAIVIANLFLFSLPFYKAMIPGFEEYFDADKNTKNDKL